MDFNSFVNALSAAERIDLRAALDSMEMLTFKEVKLINADRRKEAVKEVQDRLRMSEADALAFVQKCVGE